MKIILFISLILVTLVLSAQNRGRALGFFNSTKGIRENQVSDIATDTVVIIDFSDSTRKPLSLPTPSGTFNDEGKIAVDIWVDDLGKVVNVRFKESKSTNGSEYLIRLALMYAKTIKYDKKTGADVEYVGYVIFEFKKA